MSPSDETSSRLIKVLERSALMGPNLYAHRPCVRWKIDLGELEHRPSNAIDGLTDRIKREIPSLVEHRCSEGVAGGFFSRLEDGTWMGHVMEHIALELQSLAGSSVGFGKTRSAGAEGVYNVVYECEERETGIFAGEIALEYLEAVIAQQPYALEEQVGKLRRTFERNALGPSTRSIVDAAVRRGIPFMRIDDWNLVQFGYGANAKKIQATIASTTRHLGVELAGDKDLTKSILGFHGVPVPKGDTTRHVETAVRIANDIGWPVVVKPLDASQGRGIMTNIRDEEELRRAFEEAKKHRSSVVVERFLSGADYRLLVVNFKFVAAAQRVPAHVIGDGKHSVRELVDIVNRDPRRGESHEKNLTKIKIDGDTERLLTLRGLSVDCVPKEGEFVQLKTTANLSTGGTSVDVTDRVHPANIEMAERIARLVDLNIAGIDVVAPAIDTPVAENGGGIVEVNAAPGFRMHTAPTEGKPRPVGEAVIDMLFPPGTECRIPIITVTGTNGKTTTARICAHIAGQAGYCVGLTTSDGIYVRNQLVQKGDTTGPQSASVVLRDPSVTFAVLETARGGILRAGVAYDWSDAAIVTNIAEDHLGIKGIDTLEDLAMVKAVTVERVKPKGYAILNAEDGMTPLIRERADCNIAMFALDASASPFRKVIDDGGLGATVEDGAFVLYDKGVRIVLCRVDDVPVTFGGKAKFNMANVLASILATYATGIKTTDIAVALQSFFQSSSQTPGRLNFVDFDGFRVLIDYAHNPHGLGALCDFLREFHDGRLVAVLGLPGDRRDEDIAAAARIMGENFDEVILRDDLDLRGRKPGEVCKLMHDAMVGAGLPSERITMCLHEEEAIRRAVQQGKPGDLIVYIADKPELARGFVEKLRIDFPPSPGHRLAAVR
jgi:cyanophycin synthetase